MIVNFAEILIAKNRVRLLLSAYIFSNGAYLRTNNTAVEFEKSIVVESRKNDYNDFGFIRCISNFGKQILRLKLIKNGKTIWREIGDSIMTKAMTCIDAHVSFDHIGNSLFYFGTICPSRMKSWELIRAKNTERTCIRENFKLARTSKSAFGFGI